MMVALLVSLGSIRTSNQISVMRAKAATLADEAISALRRLDFASLTNVSNVALMNVLNNAGRWTIGTDNGSPASHSVANVLETPIVGGFAPETVSARLVLPAGAYADSTLDARWNVQADSPDTWSVGFLARARDTKNGYRLRIAQNDVTYQNDLDPGVAGTQNVYLEKYVNGTASKLASANVTLSKGSWFRSTMSLTGGTLAVSFNGGAAVITTTDATYASGPAAMLVWNGAHVVADDVQTVAAASCGVNTCWDFEGSTVLPAAWIRLGTNDLPDSTPTIHDDNATVTITSYPDVSSTNLKKAVVTVGWLENGLIRSYVTATLLGNSTVGR